MTDNLLAGTTATPKILSASLLPTASTDDYTVPASTSCVIKKAIACNGGGSAATLSLTITKAGGSAILVFSSLNVGAGDTVELTELTGLCLGPGDKITTTTSANTIRLVLSGVENS